MKKFFDQALTFRLSTNPKGGQAYINDFKFLSNLNLLPLLDYIKEEFSDSPTIKVRKTTFSLVNVTSEFVGLSIGTENTPEDGMILRSPFTLTFAMRRRDNVEGKARHVIWNTGYTCVWGNNLQRSHDFLTISIPLNIIQKCGLNRLLRPNLERLYHVLGGYTKSLALNKASVEDMQDCRKIYSAVYYKNIPVVSWYYRFDDLFFCRDIWDTNPALITGELTDLRLEYFLRYLTRYGNNITTSNSPAFKILNDIKDRLRSDVDTMKFTSNWLYFFLSEVSPFLLEDFKDKGAYTVEEMTDKLIRGNYE